MRAGVAVVACLLLVAVPSAATARYLEVRVPFGSVKDLAGLDVEIVGVKRGQWVDVVVRERTWAAMQQRGVSAEVLREDLEAYYAGRMSGRGDFGDYYTYAEAIQEMDALHAAHPSITTTRTALGITHNMNTVWAMKISDNASVQEGEPEILIQAVQHAREPIGCSIAIEFLRYLVDGYGLDPVCDFLVDQREIWIVPMVNPDGYLYNESTNPNGGGMWRKNRRDNGDGSFGVDPNRNWPYMWGYDNYGSSPYTWDETYRGPSPGSEPCVQAVMNLCNAHEFTIGVDIHSHGNILIFPWCYDDIYTPEHSTYLRLGEEFMRWAGFPCGTSWELLYNSNGNVKDWLYGEQGTKPRAFGMTPEVGEDFWQESAIPGQLVETLPFLVRAVELAGGYLEFAGVAPEEPSGNGIPEPGEQIEAFLWLYNAGLEQLAAISAQLTSLSPLVQIDQGQSIFLSVNSGFTAKSLSKYRWTILPGVLPGEVVPFQVDVTAEAGYSSTDTFNLVVSGIGYAEDCESGSPGWTHWGNKDDWHVTGYRSHSADSSWYCGQEGSHQYGSLAHAMLISPWFLVPQTNPELSFWHYYKLESNYDYAYVDVGTEGYWNELGDYTGNSSGWTQETFSLSSYAGKVVRLRFRLESDEYSVQEGWYLDDILVDGETVPSAVANLIAEAVGDSVKLTWSVPPPSVNYYSIHRSDHGYFAPSPSNQVALRFAPIFYDEQAAVGDPSLNHFYRVVAVNGYGSSPPSATVGGWDWSTER
jgi:carboxypeptidase T